MVEWKLDPVQSNEKRWRAVVAIATMVLRLYCPWADARGRLLWPQREFSALCVGLLTPHQSRPQVSRIAKRFATSGDLRSRLRRGQETCAERRSAACFVQSRWHWALTRWPKSSAAGSSGRLVTRSRSIVSAARFSPGLRTKYCNSSRSSSTTILHFHFLPKAIDALDQLAIGFAVNGSLSAAHCRRMP